MDARSSFLIIALHFTPMPKFVTNQNIEIELELGSLGDRIIAFILDSIIKAGILIVGVGIFAATTQEEWVVFILYIPIMFYSLLFEYFYNGQTPGKRARNIKVVKLDGSTPSIGSYLIRWLFRIIDVGLYVPGIVSILVTKNGQRIGDLAASTTVIRIRNVEAAQAFQSIAKSDHVITFPAVKALNDEQIELMKKALKMRKEGHNTEGVVLLVQKIKDKLKIESDLPDVKFLYIIIADYEHLANHTF